jgi:hypothetical protein
MRSILLLLLGVPIPLIILVGLFQSLLILRARWDLKDPSRFQRRSLTSKPQRSSEAKPGQKTFPVRNGPVLLDLPDASGRF